MRFALVILSATLWTGCAPKHYSLLRQDSHDWLLPPGVRKAPATAPNADPDCPHSRPITPRASHYSLYGCYVQAGFVDLQPGMRLKIVKPVLPEGEQLRTEVVAQDGLNLTLMTNATGVETRYVEVVRHGAGVSAGVGFPADVTYYRLFFLARDLDQRRKITLVGARSEVEREAATHAMDEYCSQPNAPCLAVSEGTVIAPQLAVTVRGKVEYVPLGARVSDALPAGVDTASLTLARRWRGKSRPVRVTGPGAPSLLSLPLNGGDSILW